ncbi:MAG: cell division protein FtsZ [Candidatus Micrarchaeia archaeon]
MAKTDKEEEILKSLALFDSKTEKKEELSSQDEEILQFIEASRPKIYVIGAGGSGCNTLNRMTEIGVTGATFIAMNTDAQHLLKIRADKKILLGKKLTKGLGAGSDPRIGEEAAKESESEIRKVIEDGSIVFITCGLGGGTGTGAAPLIGQIAKGMGILTVAVVTLPFVSEGRTRMKNALAGLSKLKGNVDTVIVIPNDKLLTIVPDLPLNTAFKVADEVLSSAVKGIVELVTKAGLVNLDFADLRTVLKDAGCAVVGMGEALPDVKTSERALVAIEMALNSPLLDMDISCASRALVNVIGGPDMTIKEAELMVKEVSARIQKDSHIIWGARIEENMERSRLKVLVVIAGAKMPQYGLELFEENEELDLDILA